MNNLDRLNEMRELVALRRRVMKLDEVIGDTGYYSGEEDESPLYQELGDLRDEDEFDIDEVPLPSETEMDLVASPEEPGAIEDTEYVAGPSDVKELEPGFGSDFHTIEDSESFSSLPQPSDVEEPEEEIGPMYGPSARVPVSKDRQPEFYEPEISHSSDYRDVHGLKNLDASIQKSSTPKQGWSLANIFKRKGKNKDNALKTAEKIEDLKPTPAETERAAEKPAEGSSAPEGDFGSWVKTAAKEAKAKKVTPIANTLSTAEISFQQGRTPQEFVAAYGVRREGRQMNNLEKLNELNEIVSLRRRVMKLDEEMGQMPDSQGAVCPQCGNPAAEQFAGGRKSFFCPKCKVPIEPNAAGNAPGRFDGSQQQQAVNMGRSPAGYQAPRFKPPGMNEETACSSEGPGSRTGMTEEWAQDANTSSDRKRGHELDESLDSYYKIAGL